MCLPVHRKQTSFHAIIWKYEHWLDEIDVGDFEIYAMRIDFVFFLWALLHFFLRNGEIYCLLAKHM